MDVHVLTSGVEGPVNAQAWVHERLSETLGPALPQVDSISVVVSRLPRVHATERYIRCAMVVTTGGGRRVVETRGLSWDSALLRAMRLVRLSLFAEPPSRLLPPSPAWEPSAP